LKNRLSREETDVSNPPVASSRACRQRTNAQIHDSGITIHKHTDVHIPK